MRSFVVGPEFVVASTQVLHERVPAMTTWAVRSVFSPRMGRSRASAGHGRIRPVVGVLARVVKRVRQQFLDDVREWVALILRCGGGRCRSPILVICGNA